MIALNHVIKLNIIICVLFWGLINFMTSMFIQLKQKHTTLLVKALVIKPAGLAASRLSPVSCWVIFKRARVSLTLLSPEEKWGLLVVYRKSKSFNFYVFRINLAQGLS